MELVEMNLSLLVITLIFVIIFLAAIVCSLVVGVLDLWNRSDPAAAVLHGALAFGGALVVQCALVGALATLT
jgi:hypothetical protein